MSKSYIVSIAGKDYNLIGENEDSLVGAAELVDRKIKELKKQYEGEPISTVSVLAALNIAEQSFKTRRQTEADKKYLLLEMSKMAEFIKNKINK